MITAAKKKGMLSHSLSLCIIYQIELRQAEASIRREQRKQTKEDLMAVAQRKWSDILPKFDSL